MDTFVRRFSLPAWCCAVTLCTVCAGPAAAFPDKPVRIYVGVAPGGVTDVVARLIGQRLGEIWAQPVLIENRTGAEGTIAADTVARSAPDGHSLVLVTSAHAMAKADVKPSYDPIKSFAPVTFIGMQPQILVVNNNVPVSTVGELVKLAKSKPGELNFGSGGEGTITYQAMQLFMKQTGTQMQNVTYRGGAPTLSALLGGEIQLMFGSITVLLEQVKAGKVKTLGVSSSARFAGLPDVPTVAEAGLPGFESVNWFGALAPAGTPRGVVSKLHADIVTAVNSAPVQKSFATQGIVTVNGGPEVFLKQISGEINKWKNF